MIIHCAWRLDFNLRLSSFESQIQGVRRVVDFALNSPRSTAPKVAFTSSIATLNRFLEVHPGKQVPEELIDDPLIACGAGYGESKWVSDMVCFKLSLRLALA